MHKNTRLTDGSEAFIASLHKAQTDLDQIALSLEEEFAARYKKTSSVNPQHLLARIHKLRAELPPLATECAEVLAAKKECVDAAKAQLTANCRQLSRLQTRAGIAVDASVNDDHIIVEGTQEIKAFRSAVQEFEKTCIRSHK